MDTSHPHQTMKKIFKLCEILTADKHTIMLQGFAQKSVLHYDQSILLSEAVTELI